MYIKFSGSVTDNRSAVDVSSASVQGIEIPSVYVDSSEAMSVLSSGCDNVMNTYKSKTGSNFDKISSRTNKFKDDVELIRTQILGEQKIEHLENRNNEVKNELNFLVEDVDVKGLRALLEIFDEKNQTRNIDIPQEQDITFETN